MASKTITSIQSGPTLKGGKPLFIKTQSVFTPDVNGNPIAGTVVTKLLYTPNGSDFFVAAESTKGGAPGSWELKKYTPEEIFNAGISQYVQPDGTILGPTAALSLNTKGGIIYLAAQNSIKQSATSAKISEAYQKPLASSLQNTASLPQQSNPGRPDADVGGDGTPPKPPLLPPTNDISIDIPESDTSKSIDESLKVALKYPLDMDKNQDRIKFSVRKFIGRKNINISEVNDFNLGQRDLSEILGYVFLPIQPSISDSNGVDWGGTTLNPIQAYAASASLQMIDAEGGITGAAADALNAAAKEFKSGLKNAGYQKAISLYFAQEAVGAQNLLSRTSGAVLNPNLELLFNGPTLRPFNFTFRLSPRSEPEAIRVKKIINFFKKAMSVKTAASEVFLKAPNVFDIEYQTGEENTIHSSLNRIKTCALLGCDIDYTPDGTYMTFNDEGKTMTSYQMTLRFSELDPIYNTDYADGHQIGY